MPSLDLTVQGNGSLATYTSLVGATLPFEAVDDSDGTTHDGDASYVLMQNVLGSAVSLTCLTAALATDDGDTTFVSFVQGTPQDFSHQSISSVLPAGTSIGALRVRWVATDPDGNGDVGKVGLTIGGVRYFDSPFTFDAPGYFTNDSEWATDPSDGLPWTMDKIAALQTCVQFDTVVAPSSPRVTMIELRPVLLLTECIVSFPLFQMAEGLIPSAVIVRAGAKIDTGNPILQIGLSRGGIQGYSASLFTPSAAYSVAERTFSVNPLTGAPWAAGDLLGLEGCVRQQSAGGGARLTLLSGNLSYDEPHNYAPFSSTQGMA
jgi:hypothetical protein